MSTKKPQIKITEINTTNLTAYKNKFIINNRICILTGYNGTGKSSLLEAIFHSTSEDNNLIKHKKDNWGIELIVGKKTIRNIKLTPKIAIHPKDKEAISKDIQSIINHSSNKPIDKLLEKFQITVTNYNAKNVENSFFLFFENNEKNPDSLPIGIRYTTLTNTPKVDILKNKKFPVPLMSILIDDNGIFHKSNSSNSSQEDKRKKSLGQELNLNGEFLNLFILLEVFREKYITVDESKQSLFKETINSFFMDIHKSVNISPSGAINFILSMTSEKISWTQLSKGEKQLLILLITTFTYEEAELFLIDEPEIAIHIEWQMKLLNALKKLAPSAQFIIATHSPAMFMDDNISYQIINMNRG